MTPRPMTDRAKVYVIWWRYRDNSGMGFIRAFDDQGKADDFASVLAQYAEAREINCTLVEIEREHD